ncbi:flagellar biosynthetic protein FliO [Parablautia muri]|uniref:Flagellar protein FliO/FliZ n=1 Tax=Parablautia muri TaxID=2320879 RepID=A0A9X5BII6_9FIRM|nr:flagellar biosynthetic protein FliO [Parablautia muri]NBJ93502.1 hypothetical protein [Parablautia muri]
MLLTAVSRADSYVQFMTVLILFVFVLAITYLVTRWIAGYQKGKAGCGNLEIIETCRITPNKYIQIVRAGTKYLVIAVGKDEVHMLSELSESQLDLQKNTEGQIADFASILDKVKMLKEKDKG